MTHKYNLSPEGNVAPNQVSHDPLLNFNDTQIMLGGVATSTLRQWTQERLISHYHIGKRVYYRLSDIERFLAQHLKKSNDRIAEELTQKKSQLL